MDYQNMKTHELRKLIREKAAKGEIDISGTDIVRLRFSECIALLSGKQLNTEKPIESTSTPATSNQSEVEKALGVLASALGNKTASATIDEDKVKAIVNKALEDHCKRIEVTLPSGEVKKVGTQHAKFDELLACIQQREAVAMIGPAGSGKTRAALEAAKALGLKFYCMSVGMQTMQSHIFGYNDANGNYNKSLFREAYENGGVFLFDEIDAGNAGVLTSINQATANGHCAFPDAMIEAHKDFVCIAAGNTYGRGADRQYVGRNQLDAATLDRFIMIEWTYDEKLEKALSTNDNWLARVQKLRRATEQSKVRHIISPRATLKGQKMLAAGWTQEKVEEAVMLSYGRD